MKLANQVAISPEPDATSAKTRPAVRAGGRGCRRRRHGPWSSRRRWRPPSSPPAGARKPYVCDVSQEDQIVDTVKAVVADWGRLDILINNVAISDNKHLFDITKAEWDRVLAVCLTAPMLFSKYAAKEMVAGGRGGKIINVSSTSGHYGRTRAIAYTSAKAGVINLTRSARHPARQVQYPGQLRRAQQDRVARRARMTFNPDRKVINLRNRPGEPIDLARAMLSPRLRRFRFHRRCRVVRRRRLRRDDAGRWVALRAAFCSARSCRADQRCGHRAAGGADRGGQGHVRHRGRTHRRRQSGMAREPPPSGTNAGCVQRLLDAGASIIGKTVCDEFFFSLSGANAHYGTPVNPRAVGRLPGGSSSGSASAVSAGACDVALGSDTGGGSCRVPAAFCGLYGIRPTHGRTDLSGAMLMAPTSPRRGMVREQSGRVRQGGCSPLDRRCATRNGKPGLVIADVIGVQQPQPSVADACRAFLAAAASVPPAPTEIRIASSGFDSWNNASGPSRA